MNKIKRFFEPVLENKWDLFRLIIVNIIFGFYPLVNVYFIQKIVYLIENNTLDWMISLVVSFAIFNVSSLLILFLTRNWERANTTASIYKKLSFDYMSKYNTLNNNQIETEWTWKSISIIWNWIATWANQLNDIIWAVIRLIVSVSFSIFLLWNLWTKYILSFFVIILILNFFLLRLNKKVAEYKRYQYDATIDYNRQIVKMIMSKFEILINWRNKKEVKTLNEYISKRHINAKRACFYSYQMWLLPNVAIFLWYLIFLILLIYFSFPFSTIIAVFLVLSVLSWVLENFSHFAKEFAKHFYAVDRLWKFFDEKDEIPRLKKWNNFKHKIWNFEVNEIFFSYWDNNVFSNFSLEIKWNQKTALVWESWWWKTTLMKLLSGFIEADSWNIIIDWQNIKDINLKSYYKEIWYLTQEPSVFDWTILENLIYWSREKVDEKTLKQAIKKARCDFIFDFKDWLKTEIWERWIRLSWWQKQRLAIAKLFIKNPKIIFLDEPTSALDSFSEELINESFEELFKWRTVIIIAHRLQTVKKADDIIVIEKWEIIERWTHNSLVRKNWYYKKMLDLQSGF